MRAVLDDLCASDDEAAAVIDAARSIGVDPFDFCAHRYGLGAETVLQRAAAWARLAFSPNVPLMRDPPAPVQRLDELAETRKIRARLFDRDIVYFAPRMEQLLRLEAEIATHPEIRRSTCLVPANAITAALAATNAGPLLEEARHRLTRRWPRASADLDLGRIARVLFVTTVLATVGLAVLAPMLLQLVLLPLIGVILMVPALFRMLAVFSAPDFTRPPATPLSEAALPSYSVLIPRCDEAQLVPLLRRAMTAIDYPPEKLDLMFVVEATSVGTVAAVRDLLGDPRFKLLQVPPSPPFTKPKALDYALPFVRGAHVVVYDAEDIPNPDQLRLAAAAFAAEPGIDCLQAELLVDNCRENLLTGLFAGEYAGQFGLMLPTLARWRLPMPLGGTSNHFRTSALRELGGWDAFNVTEDADLGVRLARLRYRSAMLFSQTYEEAPVSLGGWMRQRTRWMKGWMQTFIVHNRNPIALLKDMGLPAWFAFEVYVGSMILSPLLHTAFLTGVGLEFARGDALFSLADPRAIGQLGILIVGYGGTFALVTAGLVRLGQKRLLVLQALLPLYWLLHAIATLRAAHELLTRPHFWGKTTHGLTRLERSFSDGLPPPAR